MLVISGWDLEFCIEVLSEVLIIKTARRFDLNEARRRMPAWKMVSEILEEIVCLPVHNGVQ